MNNGSSDYNDNDGNHQEKNQPKSPLAIKKRTPKENPFSHLGERFEQEVILKQSPMWSRAIVWTLIGVTIFGIGWAAIAKIEQAVPAQGQLKPEGKVQEIQAPVNGVVKEVFVEDGDKVKEGQLLIIFDTTASAAQLKSLQAISESLSQENFFYKALMEQPLSARQIDLAIEELGLPREVGTLAKHRQELVAENEMFQAYLLNSAESANNLSPENLARLRATQAEVNSRTASARLEIQQLEKQLNQNAVQLTDGQARLKTQQEVLEEIRKRNEQSISQAEESLEIELGLLDSIAPIVDEGALAQVQLDRQRQEVNDRSQRLVELRANGQIEYNNQQQQVDSTQAEIDQLTEEKQRLELDINQAREQLVNTTALSERDIRDQIANNNQQIANIESQLSKLILENRNQLSEIESQISSAQQTLRYQELRAPVAGTVFDLQAGPGFVPQPSQAEALLKIVPDDTLVAEVYITNQDIGFVWDKLGRDGPIPADVRIDSFPYSEFGDIKGEVVWVGSDALPPDEINRFYRFPAKVVLDQQELVLGERSIPLQSGMSVNVNIKVRENRTVLSIFTELFTNKVESLKRVR